MTSRDWTQVARVLADLRRRRSLDIETLDAVVCALARAFGESSTRFDERKFFEIAGLPIG